MWGIAGASPALAQLDRRLELGAHVTTLRLSEFDTTDVGVGGQAGWRLSQVLTVEGALSWFPGADESQFPRIDSQQRVLGLAGVRAGVSRGWVEAFARVRPGFLRFVAEDDVACIAIFPPPLACQVLSGRTSFVTELGGGVHVGIGHASPMFVSIDVGDLLVRYTSEALGSKDAVTEHGFLSHSPSFVVGVGWQF